MSCGDDCGDGAFIMHTNIIIIIFVIIIYHLFILQVTGWITEGEGGLLISLLTVQ